MFHSRPNQELYKKFEKSLAYNEEEKNDFLWMFRKNEARKNNKQDPELRGE